MANSDSQIDKLQRGCPKKPELLDININTGTQSANQESLFVKSSREKDLFAHWWPT